MTIPETPFAAGQTAAPPRLGSIDAYRGFVMFLMMAEVLNVGRVARAFRLFRGQTHLLLLAA